MSYIRPILSPIKTMAEIIENCFRGTGKKRKACKQILRAILNTATLRGFAEKTEFNQYFSKHSVTESKSSNLIKKLFLVLNYRIYKEV